MKKIKSKRKRRALYFKSKRIQKTYIYPNVKVSIMDATEVSTIIETRTVGNQVNTNNRIHPNNLLSEVLTEMNKEFETEHPKEKPIDEESVKRRKAINALNGLLTINSLIGSYLKDSERY